MFQIDLPNKEMCPRSFLTWCKDLPTHMGGRRDVTLNHAGNGTCCFWGRHPPFPPYLFSWTSCPIFCHFISKNLRSTHAPLRTLQLVISFRQMVLQGALELMDLDVEAPEREFRYCWLFGVVVLLLLLSFGVVAVVLFSFCCFPAVLLLFPCCVSVVFLLLSGCVSVVFPVVVRRCPCCFPVVLLWFSCCSLCFLVLFLSVFVLLFVLSCCIF